MIHAAMYRSVLAIAGVLLAVMPAGLTAQQSSANECRVPDPGYDVIDEIRIDADGIAENTYDLLTASLGAGALEFPDLYSNNHPAGAHVQQQQNSRHGPFFVFTIHRDIDHDRGLYPDNADRQRNEFKAYDSSVEAVKGMHGETVRYHWFFRLADDLPVTPLFSHFMQIKAYDDVGGGLPIITLSGYARATGDQLEIRHSPSNDVPTRELASFSWEHVRGQWLEAEVIATYADNGYLRVTVTNQAGEAVIEVEKHAIDMWRDTALFNRPKWGIYRSIEPIEYLVNAVDRVDFTRFSIQKIVLR